jgi:deazaflavin-dependent oxidoreductase (nitroreductase family)
MPMPKWWGHINKRVFNPGQIKKGVSPVLTHVGRASGRTFQTPLDAHPVDGGYIFILVYGSGSDWVKNIMTAGTASLRVEGEEIPLDSPRVITDEAAWELLAPTTKRPPKFLRISEYLQMDNAR